MKQQFNIDDLDAIFNDFKKEFIGSFHTVLWRIFADGITNNKIACFVGNYDDNGIVLGIAYANEAGYCPSCAYFLTTNHTVSEKILKELNKRVFDLDEEMCIKIKLSSMFGQRIPA